MKLKEIPKDTVVHTPTEEEARELLAILHENGYKWSTGEDLSVVSHIAGKEAIGINLYNEEKGTIIGFLHIETAQREHFPIFPLADFKRKYCEEEKSLPKFKVGDKVIITGHSEYVPNIGVIAELHEIPASDKYPVDFGNFLEWIDAKFLKPYTEPETKPTVKETKESEETFASKELNLCELLEGYDNERFYCIMWGDADIVQFYPDGIRVATCKDHDVYLNIDEQGKCDDDGVCILFPSRALYEQYPLDAAKAWSVWAEEQKKHWVSVTVWIDDIECESDTAIDTDNIYFRTLADRDKCIEEINAIIEKYNK